MDSFNIELSIPTDIDGYILFQCDLCGELFKLECEKVKAEDYIEIWCPNCGLIPENILTEDVINIVSLKAKNSITNMLFDEFKKLEKNNNSFFTIKTNKKPRDKDIPPLVEVAQTLEKEVYSCCKSYAKIKPIRRVEGSYCPYCGVRQDGN